MARQHVFPVCRPRFNALDHDTIDESINYSRYSDNFAIYAGVSSTGVNFAANVRISSGEVATVGFAIEEGGEYLLNSDISAPSETTLDWTGDANGIQINAYSLNSLKNDISLFFASLLEGLKMSKELTEGDIVCIGSKPPSDSNFIRNVLPGVYSAEPDGGYRFPFSEDIADASNFSILQNSDSFNSAPSMWITLMWSGTRFVFLGSNNWK